MSRNAERACTEKGGGRGQAHGSQRLGRTLLLDHSSNLISRRKVHARARVELLQDSAQPMIDIKCEPEKENTARRFTCVWGMLFSVLHMDQPATTRVAVVCSWLHALYKLVISPPTRSGAVNSTSCLPPCPWPQSRPL